MAVGLQDANVQAPPSGANNHAISIFTTALRTRAPVLPPRTGAYARFAGIKHHKSRAGQDDGVSRRRSSVKYRMSLSASQSVCEASAGAGCFRCHPFTTL